MNNFQFTMNPYLVGAAGFQWEAGETARHSDTQLVRAARPHVLSWAVAHPDPRWEHWAPVTLHGSRKEAQRVTGAQGMIYQGSFSQPREGLVVARGRIYPAW